MNLTKNNNGDPMARFEKLGRVIGHNPALIRNAEAVMFNMFKNGCSGGEFEAFLRSVMINVRDKIGAKVASRLVQEFLPDIPRETLERILLIELGMHSIVVNFEGIDNVCARIKKYHKEGRIDGKSFPFLKGDKTP